MSAIKFLKRIATSPARSLSKKRVLKKTAARTQANEGVVNIYRIDAKNAGDFYCAPHLYFENLKNTALDIFDYKSPDEKITENWSAEVAGKQLIIGGGGLLNRGSFTKQMELFSHLAKTGKKTVLWGAGHNSKNSKDFNNIGSYKPSVKNFGLVGTRDYKLSKNWVPCVSCLHPIFDKKYETSQEVGIIFHKKTLQKPSILNKFSDFPTTSNIVDFTVLMDFIGSSEKIITDSYHAMYWSLLLGKKVVVVPNSSKFFDFKYDPVFSTFDNCLKDLKKTPSYSGILEECREKNYAFAKEVFEYLEIQWKTK